MADALLHCIPILGYVRYAEYMICSVEIHIYYLQ